MTNTKPTFNVMATVRRLEIDGYDDDGEPIYKPTFYPEIFLEGFQSEEAAKPYAASARKDPHITEAWVEPASMPYRRNGSH